MLEEGWYLMSVGDLEAELAHRRDPRKPPGPTTLRLSRPEALAFRAAGNIPDTHGRSLRLVLRVDEEPLASKRLRFEPDFHEAPTWRREGSKPVNVVPLRDETAAETRSAEVAWWEQPDVARLEQEWRATGSVAGLVIPAAYRSFVLKTIAALHSAGIDVDVESVVGSLSRWLRPEQVDEISSALFEANAKEPPAH